MRTQKEKKFAAETRPRHWKNDPAGILELIGAVLSSQAQRARDWVGGGFQRRGLPCRTLLSAQGGWTHAAPQGSSSRTATCQAVCMVGGSWGGGGGGSGCDCLYRDNGGAAVTPSCQRATRRVEPPA